MPAGLLDTIRKRLAERSSDRIEHEIEELRAEKVDINLDRGRSREKAHGAVDESVRSGADAWLDQQLETFAILQHPFEPKPLAPGLPPLVVFWSAAAGGPDKLLKRWHAAVDRAGSLSDRPLAELEKREAEIDIEIRDCRTELKRRRIEAGIAELERELERPEEPGAA
jgi:hypothetical protein